MTRGMMDQVRRKMGRMIRIKNCISNFQQSGSAGRGEATTIESGGREYKGGCRGFLQRTQAIPPEEEVLGMVIGDHRDTEVRGVGLDPLEGMEQWDLWGLFDQGGFPGRDGLSTSDGATYFHGTGNTPYIQC